MTAPGLQGGLSDAVVQLPGASSAGVQDFYAVSVQACLCDPQVLETSDLDSLQEGAGRLEGATDDRACDAENPSIRIARRRIPGLSSTASFARNGIIRASS
jgi:hypothetical protein